jgi:hypothetical protein
MWTQDQHKQEQRCMANQWGTNPQDKRRTNDKSLNQCPRVVIVTLSRGTRMHDPTRRPGEASPHAARGHHARYSAAPCCSCGPPAYCAIGGLADRLRVMPWARSGLRPRRYIERDLCAREMRFVWVISEQTTTSYNKRPCGFAWVHAGLFALAYKYLTKW